MYRINQQTNSIQKIEKATCKENYRRDLGDRHKREDVEESRDWFCDNKIEFYNHVSPNLRIDIRQS